uniref:Uncharacterized protein n=1 Tax=Timema cristinae TaxID=61476 RepID=A0A7R9DFY8_TIMCR|nr:unnamed protein product [Timema cristinae]
MATNIEPITLMTFAGEETSEPLDMRAAGKHVSMDFILLAIKTAEIDFQGDKSTLTKLLKVMGFKWQKDCRDGKYDDEAVRKIWEEALAQVTPKSWSKNVDHCERLIKEDWDRDMKMDASETHPSIIINLAEDDYGTMTNLMM